MKKICSMVLSLALLVCALPGAMAENNLYQPGDKMEDFSVTLSDGTEVSLYGLLAEKKAVFINIRASWYSPCQMDFSCMAQAYSEMSDEIGIIALTKEQKDTDEMVLALKDELGLGALPMGKASAELAARFAKAAPPTSVLVDRNGVICFFEQGVITDTSRLTRLFSIFTADDYGEPVLVHEIPPAMPTVDMPSSEVLGAALGITDARIKVSGVDMPQIWPVVPSSDGSYAMVSNGADKGTLSAFGLDVTAAAGEALAYTYSVHCQPFYNSLKVFVDDVLINAYAGNTDWTTDYVSFDEAGEHQVVFAFTHGQDVGQIDAAFKDLKLISDAEKAAIDAARFVPVAKTLPEKECSAEIVAGEIKAVTVLEDGKPSVNQPPFGILQEGDATFKIKLGEAINDEEAFIRVGTAYTMIKDMEKDEDGYLYHFTRGTAPSLMPMLNHIVLYPSIKADEQEALEIGARYWLNSEKEVDDLMDMLVEMSRQGLMPTTIEKATWYYTDGTPKQSETQQDGEAVASGTGRYSMTVTDKDGRAIEGVTVQICDDTSCRLAVTDDKGMVIHVATAYPYEMHILKVPDGYARATDAFVFHVEGGNIVVALENAVK